MPFEPGEVVVIKFPFTNQAGAKQRPAVVVSTRDYNSRRPDVILIALTSQIRSPLGYSEVAIEDWQRSRAEPGARLDPTARTGPVVQTPCV
jgi:mRNA interferase MazF